MGFTPYLQLFQSCNVRRCTFQVQDLGLLKTNGHLIWKRSRLRIVMSADMLVVYTMFVNSWSWGSRYPLPVCNTKVQPHVRTFWRCNIYYKVTINYKTIVVGTNNMNCIWSNVLIFLLQWGQICVISMEQIMLGKPIIYRWRMHLKLLHLVL